MRRIAAIGTLALVALTVATASAADVDHWRGVADLHTRVFLFFFFFFFFFFPCLRALYASVAVGAIPTGKFN